MQQLAHHIALMGRIGYYYAKESLKDTGLNGVDHGILRFLSHHDGIRQEDLSAHFNKDKSTVAKAVSRLEEGGYLCRVVNRQNKREKLVTLLEKGREQLSRIHQMELGWQQILLDGFSLEEQECFAALCRKAAHNAVCCDRMMHPARGSAGHSSEETEGE